MFSQCQVGFTTFRWRMQKDGSSNSRAQQPQLSIDLNEIGERNAKLRACYLACCEKSGVKPNGELTATLGINPLLSKNKKKVWTNIHLVLILITLTVSILAAEPVPRWSDGCWLRGNNYSFGLPWLRNHWANFQSQWSDRPSTPNPAVDRDCSAIVLRVFASNLSHS